MQKTVFKIEGPFAVATQPEARSKMVSEDPASFWKQCPALKTKVGCYVFAVRAGKGSTPLYVGKTTNGFERECFTDHKINHYNYALAPYQKGTPVMFFAVYPAKKGKINSADISDLEDFLIQVGRRINPDLRNIRGAKEPTWAIKGVIRGGKGKPNDAETNFRSLFGL